jgi:ribosome-binding ATPase YchF (GTP1/OBG family)
MGYKALQLMYFFTAGEDEVKAWTIQVYYLLVVISQVES